MSTLYWENGPARVSMCHGQLADEADANAALGMLENYRSQCHRLWFAFAWGKLLQDMALHRFKETGVQRHNRLSVGTQFPDQEQSRGSSTIARITFGELFDATADGGEFEQLNAKAFVVFADTLWGESSRRGIADALHVKGNDVTSQLMGDLHLLRNLMMHQREDAKRQYVQRAKLLSRFWTIDPDNVVITASMLHALMEQLNALHVHVGGVQQCGLDGAGG